MFLNALTKALDAPSFKCPLMFENTNIFHEQQACVQIRTAIAKEMVQDLSDISEENSLLMRETIQQSFSLNLDNVTSHPLDSTDTV